MSQIHLTVTTPEKTEFDTQADAVTVPLYDGEIGILPGHSPMVGRVGYGLLKVRRGNVETVFYVDGGFVQVTRDTVSVLTDRMQDPAKLNAAEVDRELRDALALPSMQPAQAAIKTRAVDRARARHRITTARG